MAETDDSGSPLNFGGRGLPVGWRMCRVGDLIARLDAGISVNGENRNMGEDDIGVLKTSAVTGGVFDPGQYKVVRKSERNRAAVHPLRGTLLIARCNTPALVGANVIVESDYPRLVLPDKLWRAIPHTPEVCDMRWLNYALSSRGVRAHISTLATGTSESMKNLTKTGFLNIPVAVPPLGQQREIADILGSWDQALELTKNLIALRRERHRALAALLVRGRHRFQCFVKSAQQRQTRVGPIPADWAYRPIGEVCRRIAVRNKAAQCLPILSCTKHEGLIDARRGLGEKPTRQSLAKYQIVARNQFAYATNHIEEGSLGYQNLYDAALISPMYTVFETGPELDDGYLYALLKTSFYLHLFRVNTSASVKRRGSLRWADFAKIEIPIPSQAEQRAIDEVLTCSQAEIAMLEENAKALQAQKSGIAERLLTGRLPLDSD